MTEKIEGMLSKGYRAWRKNNALAAPPILNVLATMVLVIIGLVAGLVGIIILASAGQSIISPSGPNAAAILFLLLICLAGLALFTLAIIVINAYFTSGAIGMSIKALVNGKTDLRDMTEFGGEKFMQVAYASILIFLLHLFGLLLLIPGALVMLTGSINVGAALLIAGLLVMLVYAMALNILLTLTPYAIVARDLGAVEGMKESCRTVMKNKTGTLLLLFTVNGVTGLLSLALGVFTSFVEIVPFAGIFISLLISFCYGVFSLAVLTPIFTLWWTAYSMDRTSGSQSILSQRATRPANREKPGTQRDVYV